MKHQNIIDKNQRTRARTSAAKTKPLFNQSQSLIQNHAQEFSGTTPDTFNHTMAEMKKDENMANEFDSKSKNETSFENATAQAKKIAGKVVDAVSTNKKVALGGLAAVGVAVAAGLMIKNKSGVKSTVKNTVKGAKKLLASASTKKVSASAKKLASKAPLKTAKKLEASAMKKVKSVAKSLTKSTAPKKAVKKIVSRGKSASKARA